jgi:oxygen-independent coproporphyrinogen-3 oxidase
VNLARSVYIHFPFCETKCHYCDFYSLGQERTRSGDAALFERALHLECERRAGELAPEIDTIFFGGGTPSMTAPPSMRRAIEPLRLQTRVGKNTEWTIEANPSSLSLEHLREYRKLGVNRVSMGVQALRDDLLLRLGRVHSRERALKALDEIFLSGIENVSVDLLCGVPGQTLSDLENALKTLTERPIRHLSCYLLTLPPHHAMFRELPDEETQLQHLALIHDWMTHQGFEHYEISNFARPGFQARHNLAYWKRASYVGFGPSAHSFDAAQGVRFKNVSSLRKWASLLETGEPATEAPETLSPEQVELERWMLALRLSSGFDAAWLRSPLQQARALKLQQERLLEAHPERPGYLRLTSRGFALSDHIIPHLAG